MCQEGEKARECDGISSFDVLASFDMVNPLREKVKKFTCVQRFGFEISFLRGYSLFSGTYGNRTSPPSRTAASTSINSRQPVRCAIRRGEAGYQVTLHTKCSCMILFGAHRAQTVVHS